MQKPELRQSGRTLLNNFSDAHKEAVAKKLQEELLASALWQKAETVGITVSGGIEWDTTPIIKAGWQGGKTIVVPQCFPADKKLAFYRLEGFNELEVSYYNLLEPNPAEKVAIAKAHIDLLIVPGLMFDKQGYRVGFGGGYYDRFLADYPNQTVSLAYSSQITDHIPSESYDIPVSYIVTEKGIRSGGDVSWK